MKSLALAVACLWAFCLPCTTWATDQHTTYVELLPAPLWRLKTSQPVSLDAVREWGGEPVVDREYGVKSVELRTYREDNKTAQAIVEEAADTSSAYGLLSFYQNPTMQPEKRMELTVAGSDFAYMARGKAFIRVARPTHPQISDEDFRSLLISIGGARPSSSSMALLPPPLPRDGRVPGSLKYVLGPIAARLALPFLPADLVGFQQGAELQAAAYRQGDERSSLILISYPTPQIANARFKTITRSLGVNQRSGTGSFYGKIQGSYLLLVRDASSQKAAAKLMNKLNFSQVLSWDQPPPNSGKLVAVQMFHLILGNILLVLILVGMAIGAGILLFISRRLAARWFPQWGWARGYEDSFIRLNLK